MSEILLFTKPGCQKCDYIKERMPTNLHVAVVDTTTAEGLAQAAYYELLNRNMPILVVDDEAVEGAIQILSRLSSLSEKAKA